MLAGTIAVAVVIGAGLLAGALLAVEKAVIPYFASLPAGRYVPTLTFLDDRFDPFMPWLARVKALVTIAAIVTAHSTASQVLFGAGLLCTAGVGIVSESINVALNRRIRSWDPGHPPPNWEAVRRRWAWGNRLRLALAIAGLALDCAAATAL
ncbi:MULTISPECIES: anthrone oxygenase family protein [unclassified Frankia]|uniref:anthrone oxygenase family protein n=1 Tax=unclassified Frankia TaxID=2632575 RepID=UPI0020253BA0